MIVLGAEMADWTASYVRPSSSAEEERGLQLTYGKSGRKMQEIKRKVVTKGIMRL
jgi:hypothetical protein